jgi:hypothetical protein
MKRILSPVFILALAALPVAQLRAQEPKSDAAYLELTKEYTLNPDGSMDFRLVKELKLITYRAFNSLYGETFVAYNPVHQKLKINEAFTTMASGKKVIAPKNAFNEVLPGFAVNAPSFSKLREMVITHTALERNAVIHLDYTLHSDKGYFPLFTGEEILAEQEPVKKLTVRVRVPSGTDLYSRTFNTRLSPEKTTEGNYAVYTWTVNEAPGISGEELQPGGYEAYPRLIFSSTNDQARVFTFLTEQPAFKFRVTSPMRAVIPVSMTDKLQAALKIQEKIVNEISLVNVPLKYTGYEVRTPEETWNGNYGTLMEKAVLMAAILREAGIPAVPVAVTRGAFYDPKVPVMSCLDDVAVRAECGETGAVYLSASALNSQDLRYSLPGRVFIAVEPGKPVTLKPDPFINKAAIDASLFISGENALTGDIALTLSKGFSPFLAVSRDKTKAKNYISGTVKASDIKEVTRLAATMDESVFAYAVQKDHALRQDSMLRFITLPYAANGIESWGIKQLTAGRNSPLESPGALEESIHVTLSVPENLHILNSLEPVDISNKAGTFAFSITLDSGKLVIKKEIRLKDRIILPDVYGDFKTLMDNWNVGSTRELMFTEKK